jgi:NitT/TauT family transport system permease protein
MTRTARVAHSLLGLLAFVVAWQGVVLLTRPAITLRPTLAFSRASGGEVTAVLIDARGAAGERAKLSVEAASRAATVGRLRLWLGSSQPTLAAVPAGAEDVRSLLSEAKVGFGGGLEIIDVPGDGPADPVADATARGTTVQRSRSIRPTWLPGPIEALVALGEMVKSGEMARHIVASLFRVATGFVLATLVGVPFGLALGTFARLSALCNAVIQCLRPISPIAWLPVATLGFGGGDVAAVFLIFLSSFFPIAVSTSAAVATVDLKYRRSAMNFGVTGLAAATRVTLPASLPSILTALRIALGISWVVVVAAEMLGVESGLGYLVLDARNQLRYDRVVAAMIVIGLIGLCLDAAVRAVEQDELSRRGLVR